jgi:hypothetical protein
MRSGWMQMLIHFFSMISLCQGHKPKPLWMSTTSRYFPEQLLNEAYKYQNADQMITLQIGNEFFHLKSREELILGARIVAAYHNQFVTSIDPSAEYSTQFDLGDM